MQERSLTLRTAHKCGRAAVAAALLAVLAPIHACAQPSFEVQRAALVAEIERDVRETQIYTGKVRLGDSVIDAMSKVAREEFVPEELRARAYENRPLPIGSGQTISQPFIVALMTDLAAVGPESVVLEVGTGSGYQAAVLAEIVDHVYTIEIVEPLGRRATETLARLGYDNVTTRIGDGYRGWPEAAPFDAIVVTAAPEEVPVPLIEQLKVGGRIVIPVGPQDRTQSLRVLEKSIDGSVETSEVLPVMFVPFTRDNAQ
jgi:protein-L-isoaspartate(D-aspartate) O-methyltransferase